MTGLTLDPPFPLRIQELSGETLLVSFLPTRGRALCWFLFLKLLMYLTLNS